MKQPMGKQQIIEAMQDLPAEATIDQAMYKLYVLDQVQQSLADTREKIPHKEIKQRHEIRTDDEIKKLIDEIAHLPVDRRARLADAILQTLNPMNPEIEQAWATETRQRLEAVKDGTMETIPGEQVMEEADEIVSGKPRKPFVKEVKPQKDWKLKLTFENGEQRILNITPYMIGVFTELKDPDYFRQVQVVDGSIGWPHGQDLAHDMLYQESRLLPAPSEK